MTPYVDAGLVAAHLALLDGLCRPAVPVDPVPPTARRALWRWRPARRPQPCAAC